MLPTNLFEFAYIPLWYEQLYGLSQMALPEPWRFRSTSYSTQNDETPILERYINQVFSRAAVEYNFAPMETRDSIFYLRNEFCCFHTGLYTNSYKPIYVCFDRNKKKDTLKLWYFRGFLTAEAPKMKYIHPLPHKPSYPVDSRTTFFHPDWEIRIRTDHILKDSENRARLPEQVREHWNLPLLLETAVELARRRAVLDWSIVVPQVFQGRVQLLLPICLTDPCKPDLAMALAVMNGYYVGHTCLTPQMAYQNARMLCRPSAKWLTELVETTALVDRQHQIAD